MFPAIGLIAGGLSDSCAAATVLLFDHLVGEGED